MKKIGLKLSAIALLAFFGLIGCLSSEGQAKSASKDSATTTASESQYVEGKHFVEIFPEMNTSAAEGKIEVIELFWLGCPHCFALEPTIKKYKESLVGVNDVEFSQIPAALNPSWGFHAKAIFTAQILDPKDEKHLIEKLFKAYHDQNNRLNNPELVKDFFVAQGFSETQFNNTFNSMALNAAMSNAKTIGTDSQATSVPSIIVNGKYRTGVGMAGGPDKLIEVVDMLVEKERKASK